MPETPEQMRDRMQRNAAVQRSVFAAWEQQQAVVEQAENQADTADKVWRDALDDQFLAASGSVAERQAIARVATRELRDQRDAFAATLRSARFKLDRLDLKRRQIDREQMGLQSALKSMIVEGA